MSNIQELEKRLLDLKAQIREARKNNPPEPVTQDYTFQTPEGSVTLASLFGDKDELLLVHNMGERCDYCSLWVDSLNGLIHQIESRAAFVTVSPDPVDQQQALKQRRGWKARFVQDDTGDFTKAMGFFDGEHWHPGVSAFRRTPEGQIVRTNWSYFGPGDDFCGVWPLWELLDGGEHDWQPLS